MQPQTNSQGELLLTAKGVGFVSSSGKVFLENLNFELSSGQVLRVFGTPRVVPTTLVQLLVGTRIASEGEVDCRAEAEEIFFVPRVRELRFQLPLSLNEILEREVGAEAKTEALSFGLLTESHFLIPWNETPVEIRKKFLLTLALLKRPKLLIVDEPFPELSGDEEDSVSLALWDFLTKNEGTAAVIASEEPLQALKSLGIPVFDLILDSAADAKSLKI